MKMDNSQIEEEISNLSLPVKRGMLDLINTIKHIVEITPKGSPIKLSSLTYTSDGIDDNLILQKFEEWGYIELAPTVGTSMPVIHTTTDKLREIEEILRGTSKQKIADNKITEIWDRTSGIWEITIPDEEKPIEIKLGKQTTETNETFFVLYSKQNKDVSSAEIRNHVAKTLNKNPKDINVGSSIATLRKWIKKGLTKKYEHSVLIQHDKSTKTYKLEIKF